IDEVVAAIGKHGDGDMEAVSREVQLPLEMCQAMAKKIARILPSMAQPAQPAQPIRDGSAALVTPKKSGDAD
ncbi:hypothetical protein LPJ56_003885, partial [Coemansia sp. RSA 2599]